MDSRHNLAVRVGAFIGLATFVIFGIKVGIVYGGLVGVATASVMLGHAIAGEIVSRIIVAGGMLMGVLAVGSMMTVMGALAGAIFDVVVLAPITNFRIRRLIEKKN